MDISEEVSGTLRAESHGHPPCVMAAGFCTEHSAASRSIGYVEECAPTLRAGVVPAAVYENHSQDTHYTGPLDTAPTVSSTYGTRGNNQPFMVQADTPKTQCVPFCKGTRPHSAQEGQVWKAAEVANTLNTFDVGESRCAELAVRAYGISSYQSKAMLSDNPHAGIYEANTSRTIDQSGCNPGCNQGGIAVLEGAAYAMTMCGFPRVSKEQAPTLLARDFKDPTAVNRGYTVRRLTPTECARLQGFPDWWCAGLETPEPTEADISFWSEVWETHRRIIGTAAKPKTRNQIVRWLQAPHSDSAEYKMWGNGVALPCVFFVMAGIVWSTQIAGE